MTAYDERVVEELRGRVSGRVVGPADADWELERQAWHTLVPQEPVAVVHVTGVEDVQAVVRIAAEWGFPVAPQPRGHGATSHTSDGAIVLRFQQLGGIERDGDVVRVTAGVAWRDLNVALDGTGLTALPGSNGDTTVVGFSVSGGLSWFGRKYGLAAHQIRSVELVDADGELRTVTEESDPELLWAIRGGGGEFGIVTALELQLQPAPEIYGGRKLWAAEHGRDLLRAYAEITATAPDELSLWAWLMNMPDIEQVPPPLRGRVMIGIGFTYLGDADEAEKLLAPLYAVAEPELGAFGAVTTGQLGAIAQEPEDPMPALGRVHLLTGMSDDVVDALLDEITSGRSPIAAIQVRHLGGALARATTEDGPAGAYDEQYLVLLGAAAPVPELVALVNRSFDDVTAKLGARISGRVPMTLSEDEPIEAIFGAKVLDRLRAVKRRVDPSELFRGNHPLSLRV
jgi:hypothetical protein